MPVLRVSPPSAPIPEANPLKTASGKIEIHSPTIAAFGYADCPPHPMWLEPDEWHGNAEAGQLQLLSAHPAHRLHSQLNHTALRERYAVAGREPVTIHPQDAQARGIVDGDLVRVWNARGQVLAGAVVTEGIRPGVICLHEGAWPDWIRRSASAKNGAVNVLTKDIPTSRLGNGCAGNTAPRRGWRNIPARRCRLRHLIRRPTHNPRRVLSIVLPCAVFNPEALRMVETDRRFVLLINLKAQPGVVLFDFIQQRPANALGGWRPARQTARRRNGSPAR